MPSTGMRREDRRKFPNVNRAVKLARSSQRRPPNLLAVDPDQFSHQVLRVLDEVFVCFNGDGWDLASYDWASSPKDLNHLVSVICETTPGWPLSVRNIDALPAAETSILVEACRGGTLPWFEADGSVGDISFPIEPIALFGAVAAPDLLSVELLDLFDFRLVRDDHG